MTFWNAGRPKAEFVILCTIILLLSGVMSSPDGVWRYFSSFEALNIKLIVCLSRNRRDKQRKQDGYFREEGQHSSSIGHYLWPPQLPQALSK